MGKGREGSGSKGTEEPIVALSPIVRLDHKISLAIYNACQQSKVVKTIATVRG